MHRLALILVLTGCVADSGDEGFNITQNLAPEANCALTPGGAFLARGLIDKQSPNPYVFTPEFSSRIIPAMGVDEFQRTIMLRGAKIEVTNAETGATVGMPFKSLFSASLAPQGKTTAAFDIVTPAMLQASGATGNTRVQLIAKVTPFGTLGGGDTIDGVPFEYPVTVCDGCVANILGACPLPAGTTIGASMPNSCNQFQDGLIQCCMGENGPVCPPTTQSPPVALTVAKTGAMAANATVTSTPAGINCGTACSAMFPVGTAVTLTATGVGTYSWSDGTCANNAACTVTLSAAQNVTLKTP